MHPRAVEAEQLGEQDVPPDGLVVRRGVNPVRIEALVQHKPLEHRRPVEEQTALAQLHTAQAEIALHAVENRPAAFQRQLQIVQRGRLYAPQPHGLHRQRAAHRRAAEPQQRLSGGLAAQRRPNAQRAAVRVPVEEGGEIQLAIARVGRSLPVGETLLRHKFQPDGLPDAGGAGVVAALGRQRRRLLARRLEAAADVVPRIHDKDVLPGAQQRRDVQCKRGVAAGMPAGERAVDEHLGFVVHRAEMQQDVARQPFGGDVEAAQQPDGG